MTEERRGALLGIIMHSEPRHIIMPGSFVAYILAPVLRHGSTHNRGEHCPVRSYFCGGTSFTFLRSLDIGNLYKIHNMPRTPFSRFSFPLPLVYRRLLLGQFGDEIST